VPEADSYIGKTLVVALESEPETLLPPAAAVNAPAGAIDTSMYDWLYDCDADGNVIPRLATGYEWVDDTHLRVHLRDDVYFYDGSPLTAEDVIYTWQLGQQGTSSPSYGDPWDVPNFKAEDDHTVIMALTRVVPFITEQLYGFQFAIVGKNSVEGLGGMQAASTNPLCNSGRYNFAEWKPGQYIMLKYNENYWDKSFVPGYEYIKYTAIPDAASRCLAVKSGDADLAINISLNDTLAYTSDSSVDIVAVGGNGVGGTVFWYRCDEGPFADPKVREAVSYLIDWKECAAMLTGDPGNVTQGWFNKEGPYYGGEDTRVYDPAKGIALMKESGYPDGFAFEFKIEPTDGYEAVAELMQAYLLEANIKATLVNVEAAAWFTMFAETAYEAYIGGAASTPLTFALAYIDSRTWNFGGPRVMNDEMAGFLDVANTTFDEAERETAISGLQKYVTDNYLCEGIASTQHYNLASKSITGYKTESSGYILCYTAQPAQ
jgi:peptide/nickel transport system substrate-binding protein